MKITVGSNEPSNELLMITQVLHTIDESNEGHLVKVLAVPWRQIYHQLEGNPQLFYEFSRHPTFFEEFIAGAYDSAGFKVTLTPRSGDGGKDVIAEKTGFGAVRILDQCKAFSKGHRVGQEDVRALIGVLGMDANASKAVLTTTSQFSPGVRTDPGILKMVPYRLELRDGQDLRKWLSEVQQH